MIKNGLKTSSFLFALLLSVNLFAQQTFIREYTHEMEKGQSVIDARVATTNEIKRALSEELGSYIVSQSKLEVRNSNEDSSVKFANRTRSISMALMKLKVLKEVKKKKTIYIRAEVKVDQSALSSELSKEGISQKENILAVVFKMLKENNVGATSIVVLKNSRDLLKKLSSAEKIGASGATLTDLKQDTQGHISEGDEVLHGEYKFYYGSGAYSQVTMKEGYMNGLFQFFSSDNNILLEGQMSANKQKGTWKQYRESRSKRQYLVRTSNYINGVLHGKTTLYKDNSTQEVETVFYYEHGQVVLQENHSENSNEIFKGGINKQEKKEGKWEKTKNGKLIARRFFKNGELHGKYIAYYDNGEVSAEGEYKNGKHVGNCKTYFDNGQVQTDDTYNDKGDKIGTSTTYYRNGQLSNKKVKNEKTNTVDIVGYYNNGQLRRQVTYKNSRLHGKSVRYFENGQLKEEATYKQGKKTGLYKTATKEGNPIVEEYYKIVDGRSVLHGQSKKYNRGKIYSDTHYANGKEEGVCIRYYKGNKQQERLIKNGKLMNDKFFYKDGTLQKETSFPNGDKTAFVKQYHQNGALRLEESYKDVSDQKNKYRTNQIKEGVFKRFSPEGTLLEEKHYKGNQVQGLSNTFSKTGTPLEIATYEKGKLEGAYEKYNRNGDLILKGNYANGDKEGVFTQINPSSGKQTETTYANGKIVQKRITDRYGACDLYQYPYGGKLATYTRKNKSGIVIEEGKYSAPTNTNAKSYTHTLHGERKQYNSKGKLKLVDIWEKGKRNGKAKEYHASGVLKSESTYVMNKRGGTFVSFRDTKNKNQTQILTYGAYENNKKVGTWLTFYPNGKVKEVVYGDYQRVESTKEYVDAQAHGKTLKKYKSE